MEHGGGDATRRRQVAGNIVQRANGGEPVACLIDAAETAGLLHRQMDGLATRQEHQEDERTENHAAGAVSGTNKTDGAGSTGLVNR